MACTSYLKLDRSFLYICLKIVKLALYLSTIYNILLGCYVFRRIKIKGEAIADISYRLWPEESWAGIK